MENRIAELKHDLGADGFCLQQFFATEAAFQAVLLLFNLLSEFQRASLPVYREPATLRTQVFTLRCHPGPLGPPGPVPVAKLGWVENTQPADRQDIELGNPNFAEVRFCRRHLIQTAPSPSINSGKESEVSGLNFVFQAYNLHLRSDNWISGHLLGVINVTSASLLSGVIPISE